MEFIEMIIRNTIYAIALISMLPASAIAEVAKYDVQQLRYHNHGAYYVQVKLRWKDSETGEMKNCRKDSTKFYYASGNGEEALFSSAGTTYNNNHCKVKCATNCSDSDE